jgi:outer membrane protein assembly factor BamD (BamD/ComL family)
MKRLLSLCAVVSMVALPAFGSGSGGAGSPGEPVVKAESPAVTAYNQGVDFMKARQFAQAEDKFEQAVKLDPGFAEAYKQSGIYASQTRVRQLPKIARVLQ